MAEGGARKGKLIAIVLHEVLFPVHLEGLHLFLSQGHARADSCCNRKLSHQVLEAVAAEKRREKLSGVLDNDTIFQSNFYSRLQYV